MLGTGLALQTWNGAPGWAKVVGWAALIPMAGVSLTILVARLWYLLRFRALPKAKRTPSVENLSLIRMRRALRAADGMSALLSAALLLPLTIVVSSGIVIASRALMVGSTAQTAVTLGIAAAMGIAGAILWLILDAFFTSASKLATVASLLLLCVFFSVYRQLFGELVHAPSENTFSRSAGIALSFAAGYHFWWLGLRTLALHSVERRLIAKAEPGSTIGQKLFGPLAIRKSPRRVSTIAAVATLHAIAKMIQGLSTLIMLFATGAIMFTAMLGILGGFDFMLGKRPGDRFGTIPYRNIVSWYLIVAFVTAVLAHIAMGLKQLSRRWTRYSFEHAIRADTRPPLLFLRSFQDDQVTLPSSPLYIKYWLAEPHPRRLDHALVERFGYLAPVVALGKSNQDEKDVPFGAARLYTNDSDWQNTLKTLAVQACGIVVVVEDSEGISLEIRWMLNEPFVKKSLFLASPRKNFVGLEAHPIIGPILAPYTDLTAGFHILGAFRKGEGWYTLCTPEPAADDYLVCSQVFMRRHLLT